MNICLKRRRVPAALKKSTTILIHKKSDIAAIGNWRPYKLYTGCLAKRLKQWLIENSAINPCQKGFLLADGAFEHVHMLQRQTARTGKSDCCVACLDVSKAFGEIPHNALLAATSANRAGRELVEIIVDIYTGISSTVAVDD